MQDDEAIKRKILIEDLERSGQFLRDFMSRHNAALEAADENSDADDESVHALLEDSRSR